MVLAARVITLTTAHQFNTGNWLRITCCTISPKMRVSAASRVKLCTTITLARASCAVPARAVWKPCARRWPSSVFRITNIVRTQLIATNAISDNASCQLRKSVSGSSTAVAMIVESCSLKKLSQRPNIASVPESIVFIIRPECASPWNDSGRCRA